MWPPRRGQSVLTAARPRKHLRKQPPGLSHRALQGCCQHPCQVSEHYQLASAAISIRRVARLSRNVGQPDHILTNPVMSHQAERRPRSGEIWFAVTKDDWVQVDSILIDQAKFGEAL